MHTSTSFNRIVYTKKNRSNGAAKPIPGYGTEHVKDVTNLLLYVKVTHSIPSPSNSLKKDLLIRSQQ